MRYALQRLLPAHDCAKWRTVHRFELDDALAVMVAAHAMGQVGHAIKFRIVTDDQAQNGLLDWSRATGWVKHIRVAMREHEAVAA